MNRRRGFTLLELIVSITIAGVIALLVYSSASAGFDTRDALAKHRAGAESELRVRSVLSDALRHASDEADAGVSAFDLVDAIEPSGLPADQLTFLTRGVLPPLGATALWRLTVSPSAAGLIVRGEGVGPQRDGTQPGYTAVLSHVRGLDVEVASVSDRAWITGWPSNRQLPVAARLTFYDATGQLVGPPLVVRVGLEGMR